MATFKDITGREWEIPHFDGPLIDDVHQATNVSLYTLTAGKMEQLTELYQNRAVFWNVIYILVGAKKKDVSEADFAKAMIGGDVLDDAQEAFWKELLFFSPKKLRELLTKMRTQTETIIDQEVNPNLDSKITAGLRKLFGDLLESPDSNPAA